MEDSILLKEKKKKDKSTVLSERDKKVLDKYTKSYTNLIESGSAYKKIPRTENDTFIQKSEKA